MIGTCCGSMVHTTSAVQNEGWTPLLLCDDLTVLHLCMSCGCCDYSGTPAMIYKNTVDFIAVKGYCIRKLCTLYPV